MNMRYNEFMKICQKLEIKNSKNDIKISSQGGIHPVKDDEKFSALGRIFERSKLFFNLIGEKMIIINKLRLTDKILIAQVDV